MFQHQGIWLPDGEKHFPDWMTQNGELVDGRGTYQIRKFREAMKHVRSFRRAVDVGAHVGLWTMQIRKRFETTEAFEPVEQFWRCFLENVATLQPASLVNLRVCALGAAHGRVAMKIDPADSGGTHVAGNVDSSSGVEMRTLDSFCFDDVDFVKIDCEGYEHHVVEGARATLERCHPCVIVEQKPHKLGPNFGIKGTPAVDLLRGMGALIRAEMGGDYVLSWV